MHACHKLKILFFLFVIFIFFIFALDNHKQPSKQLTTRSALLLIDLYQHEVRPITEGFVQCRFEPSCSEYSKECLKIYGFPDGFIFSAYRIIRCQNNVPRHTFDPPTRK